ncbi:ECF RNA polymerase sigma factor SigW [Planctomycetes bacterium Poly30]|uniref:ECF RNA polymerase sigma factor SigW n=1 Tax=Saltatorellus ferox TaxID=2528018 RepID=A0A518ET32_9BACT|nr:ECF RNA polymerase sigma factor SigW [Planctomycetes bacterium Poly30]
MTHFSPASLNALLDETEWVRALARRLVDSTHEAEDLAQETMTRALVSPPTDGRSIRGWLSVVLANRLRARLRRPDPALDVARDAAPAHEPSALETVERAEAHQAVVDAVMSLAEPFRTTVLLRYFEGCGPSEIAALENVPLATITSRLTRAHARLRAKLQDGDSTAGKGLLGLTPLLAPARGSTSVSLPTLASASLLITMSTPLKLAIASALVALGVLLSFHDGNPEPALPGETTIVEAEAGPDGIALSDAMEISVAGEAARVELNEAAEAVPEAVSDPGSPPVESPMLTGIVMRPDGTPAPGATVIMGGFGALLFIEMKTSPPDFFLSVKTEEDGTFRFEDLPEERTLLTAGCAGFAPSESVVWVPGDATDLHLTLREGGRIYGSVHRRDGSLARGRKVRLMQDGGTMDPLGRRLIRFATTDAQGNFDERGLCPGEWGIVSYPDDEELEEIGGTMVDHMIQATVRLQDGGEAHVPLGAPKPDQVVVTGRVTIAGEPAQGILQWLRECEDPMGSSTNIQLASDGSYRVELEEPGTWYVRASGRGTGEFLPSIPKVSEYQLDLELPGGELSGLVVDEAGEPVKGASVSLQVTEGEFERGPLRASGDIKVTNKKGRFTLQGLKDGVYLVGAVHDELGVAPSQLVEISEGQAAEELTFVLRGGHRVHGSIKGPEGFRANGCGIWIYDEEGRLLNPVASLTIGKGAIFSTPPLPPGRYSLFVLSGLNVAQAVDLNVEEADLEGVDLQLQPGAVLTVETLVDGERRRGLVSATDDTGRLLTGQRFNRDPWQWRHLPFDSTRKRIGPLPPGTYDVSSHVPGVGTATETVTIVGAEMLTLTLRHD